MQTLVLMFWAERGMREDDLCHHAAVVRGGGATRSMASEQTKGAMRGGSEASQWINPCSGVATGLKNVTTEDIVKFMLSGDVDWFWTDGSQKIKLLRTEHEDTANCIWPWFGVQDEDFCFRTTPDLTHVPGFCLPSDSGVLTGPGWQLMHEVKANPVNHELARSQSSGWSDVGELRPFLQGRLADAHATARRLGSHDAAQQWQIKCVSLERHLQSLRRAATAAARVDVDPGL